MAKDPCKVLTEPCRSTYMYVTKLEQRGKKITADTPKTVRTGILINKRKGKATISAIHKAIKAASMKKFGKMIVKLGRDGYPLRDADEEIESDTLDETLHELYAGHYFLTASQYHLPGLVDADNDRIEDTDERADVCVSGYHFRFSITFKGYDNESKGVRVLLNNLMFIKEDDRLDGGVAADNEEWDADIDEDDDYDSSREARRKTRRNSRRNRD